MKNRVVLSIILFLFLLFIASCGIPTWFYIESSGARLSNSSTNLTTTITVDTDFLVDVKFLLLYTIHNGTSSTTPSTSSIQYGLTSNFRSRYRTSNANSNRFANNARPVATYDHTSSSTTFNMYPLTVTASSDGSMPLNGAGSSYDYLFALSNDSGGTINATVTYNISINPENQNEYILTATLNSTSGTTAQNGVTYTLSRFNRSSFVHSSSYANDSNNDNQGVENDTYNLYLYPVMYISANGDTEHGHNFSNIMLVTSDQFISIPLTGGSVAETPSDTTDGGSEDVTTPNPDNP